jgi:hypothetical protein
MAAPSLITLTDPRSQASEAYRTLRTNLISPPGGRAAAHTAVTSPAPKKARALHSQIWQ